MTTVLFPDEYRPRLVRRYRKDPSNQEGGSMSDSQARMIATAILLIAAALFCSARGDVDTLGVFLAFFAIIAFGIDYVLSWRRNR